ncbi:MAG: formate dehydrogenase iron-sulfur subunit [Bacteroidota bacterium]|nr:formate dehydrogenase iron-sulfur subunit [Bacteroidota bacterium]
MYSILVDVTKCTGCEQCVKACIKANNLDADKADYARAASIDGLSDNRLLSIIKIDRGRFVRKSCMHCLEPSCVSACLVGGISKSADGPVIYDPDKCIGCRYCMLSCPFGIPRYEWSKTVPFMKKCQMCYSRLKENRLPACVEACPNQAIVFGERNEMLKKAYQIINSNGDKYVQHVWGEKEFGGSSLLYISDTELSEIGWKKQFKTGIPELTEPLIEKTPIIGMGVASSLIGLNWLVRRKNKIAKEAKENHE